MIQSDLKHTIQHSLGPSSIIPNPCIPKYINTGNKAKYDKYETNRHVKIQVCGPKKPIRMPKQNGEPKSVYLANWPWYSVILF